MQKNQINAYLQKLFLFLISMTILKITPVCGNMVAEGDM